MKPSPPPDIAPARALELLRRQLEAGQSLREGGKASKDQCEEWCMTTAEIVRRSFGLNTYNYGRFQWAGGWSWGVNLKNRLVVLRSCLDQLATMAPLVSEPRGPGPDCRRVFLVHGRDEGVRETVRRFLEQLGLAVTVLRDEANLGRTVIEKFEDFADVGFAVVLLTGDDRGGLAETAPRQLRPRARQNVILELGYFLARLGRARVCPLYEPGVELPSDYEGTAFIQLDAQGGWRTELARELRTVGFEVDLNRLAE